MKYLITDKLFELAICKQKYFVNKNFAIYILTHKATLCLGIWPKNLCELNEVAGALVEWLWEETHVPTVVGSNLSAIYWMDITFFHIYLL